MTVESLLRFVIVLAFICCHRPSAWLVSPQPEPSRPVLSGSPRAAPRSRLDSETVGRREPAVVAGRLRSMRMLTVAASLIVFAGACGEVGEPAVPSAEGDPAVEQITSTTLSPISSALPPGSPIPVVTTPGLPMPPVLIRFEGTDTVLSVWSSCWRSGNVSRCGDGSPPVVPPDIGNPAEIEVVFETPGWRFSATAVPSGESCGGRSQSMDLPATGPTTHRLLPIGTAGDYTITLNGRSTDAATNPGDLATTFRWHTTKDGPNEAPSATVSIVPSKPGDRLSFAGELSARALGISTRPDGVKASAMITSSTGASMTVEFHPHPGLECVPEGSLSYRTDAEVGRQMASLGPPPFRYEVSLLLDSVPYLGTATWPDDEMSECSPCTRLRFNPPLPAL